MSQFIIITTIYAYVRNPSIFELNCTEEEEKATKLADGLTGRMFKNVPLMNPISPADFLSKAAEATDLTYQAIQRTRPNRDTIMPHDMTNPPEVAVVYAYKKAVKTEVIAEQS